MKKYIIFNLDYPVQTPIGTLPQICAICDTQNEAFKEIKEIIKCFNDTNAYDDYLAIDNYKELVDKINSEDSEILMKIWEWEPM